MGRKEEKGENRVIAWHAAACRCALASRSATATRWLRCCLLIRSTPALAGVPALLRAHSRHGRRRRVLAAGSSGLGKPRAFSLVLFVAAGLPSLSHAAATTLSLSLNCCWPSLPFCAVHWSSHQTTLPTVESESSRQGR
jgi:hypothetical protein